MLYRKLIALALALALALCVPALAEAPADPAEETIEAPVEPAAEAPVADEVAVEADAAIPAEAEVPATGLEAGPAETSAEALPEAVGTEEDPLANAAGEAPVETAEEAAESEAPLSDEITPPADLSPNYAGDTIHVYYYSNGDEVYNGQTVYIKAGVALSFYCEGFDRYGNYSSDTGVTWTTSNKNVAYLKQVNGGQAMAIIGKKAGSTARITVQPTHGGEKRTFKVKVVRNTLSVNKSAPMGRVSYGRCGMALKNIEIVNRSKITAKIYLINKQFRKTKYIKNLKIKLQVVLNGTTYNLASRTISRKDVQCYRNSSKVITVNFTGSQVKKANFNLKKAESIYSQFSGTIYGKR